MAVTVYTAPSMTSSSKGYRSARVATGAPVFAFTRSMAASQPAGSPKLVRQPYQTSPPTTASESTLGPGTGRRQRSAPVAES